MYMLAFLIGLFGFPVCLVLLIIKAIRKKPKKKVLIAMAICFALFVLGVCLFPSQTKEVEVTPTPTPVVTVEPSPTPTPTPKPTPEATPAPTTDPAENAQYCKKLIEAALKDNYDYSTVEGDETGYIISIARYGLAEAVTITKAAGYDENYAAWMSVKKSLIDLSNSIQNTMNEAGLKNAVLMINVLNDGNHDNVLLSIINGLIVYDVMAQ